MREERGREGAKTGTAVWVCLLVPAVMAAACILAPVLARLDPNEADPMTKFLPVSLEHLMGTDYLGRDIFSRILWGGRVTMGYAFLVTFLAAVTGTCAGMISGAVGGIPDSLIMRGSDVLRAFPGVIVVLIAVSVLGAGIRNVCLAMVLTRWIWYARVSRNLTREEFARTSIQASRLAGSSWGKILRKNVFPAIFPHISAIIAIDFGSVLLAISGYSFLGFGIQPPDPEWGMMINDGRNHMEHPGMMFWPGICVVTVVICTNILGDVLRDKMEEKRS